MIRRFAGVRIRCHAPEPHGVGSERLLIERIDEKRHHTIGESFVVQVAGAQPRPHAHIPRVATELLVVSQRTANLTGLVIAPQRSPRRHANHGIELHTRTHQHVHHSGGEHATHRTAFEHKADAVRAVVRGRIVPRRIVPRRIVSQRDLLPIAHHATAFHFLVSHATPSLSPSRPSR